jgi:hypothetical protein
VITDPLSPEIDQWLRTLNPLQELATRYALRGLYPEVRANQKFTARIDELRAQLNPDEDQLADILTYARTIGDQLRKYVR